jgi:hypothetical protein
MMIRFSLANVIGLLTDSLRYLILLLVLLWLVVIAASIGI